MLICCRLGLGLRRDWEDRGWEWEGLMKTIRGFHPYAVLTLGLLVGHLTSFDLLHDRQLKAYRLITLGPLTPCRSYPVHP